MTSGRGRDPQGTERRKYTVWKSPGEECGIDRPVQKSQGTFTHKDWKKVRGARASKDMKRRKGNPRLAALRGR